MNKGLLGYDVALAQLVGAAHPVAETELVATIDACGRVLAQPVRSTLDVPPRDVSMMDGYAVRAMDVAAPGCRLPVSQRIPAGSVGRALEAGTAARIFTGAPLPARADAVVMQEFCAHDGEAVVVNHVPHPGEWITRRGADISAGVEVLAAGARLRPQDIGLAASVGLREIAVYRRLRVALFSTGNELVMPGEPLTGGAIYNSNRFTLRGLLQLLGCTVHDLGIVPDAFEATRSALRQAANANDLILTSGGVSVGEDDHVKPAVEAEGALSLWKIAIKPGKPLAFGRVADAAFIGLPGNPVSSFVTFVTLVRPYILRRQGAKDVHPRAQQLVAGFDWPTPEARREFLRARLGDGGALELFPNQSSAVLTSTTWADGLVDNPPAQSIARGDRVRFLSFSDLLY